MARRAVPDADAFQETLARLNLSPLWERKEGGLRPEPAPEPPVLWRWRDVEPLLDEAVRRVPMEAVERRVLTLRNPDKRFNLVTTTTNLNCGLQILLPRETARPHRHTANALRFVVEGAGACTFVDGKPCPMAPRDLILNPAWTWHAHEHEGSGRVVWVDLLDVPLFRHFDFMFFETTESVPATLGPEDDAYAGGGVLPLAEVPGDQSPLCRFPWARVEEALARTPPAKDGSRAVRYVNPATGGAVLSMMDCHVLRLPKTGATIPARSTANAICVVVEGTGRSVIGDSTIEWARNDIFTVPHWSWVSHQALEPGSSLFVATDAEAQRRLGFLRTEQRDG